MQKQTALFFAFALAWVAPVAAENTRLEFDYVNSPKGYTTTVTINSNWSVSLVKVRRNVTGERSTKVIQLNREQLAQVQTLLSGVHPDSLTSAYGLNSHATDEPKYVFRFPHDGTWKEIRIEPYLSAPLAPAQILVLKNFLMQLAISVE